MMISGSGSAYGTTSALQAAYKRLDANADNSLSRDEFIAGASDADAAGALFDRLASYGTDDNGGLTQEGMASAFAQLSDAMRSLLVSGQERGGGGPGGGRPDLSELDTDDDGQISREEFLAGRPDDVSEEDAQALWDDLDSEGTGSLSVADLQTAMEARRPPPGPPPSSADLAAMLGEGEESEDDTTSATASAASQSSMQSEMKMMQTLLDIITGRSETTARGAAASVLT